MGSSMDSLLPHRTIAARLPFIQVTALAADSTHFGRGATGAAALLRALCAVVGRELGPAPMATATTMSNASCRTVAA